MYWPLTLDLHINFSKKKRDPYRGLYWWDCLFVCTYIQHWTFKITSWTKIHILCTEQLLISLYITDNMLALQKLTSSLEPGRWVDKWERKEFECADEWSWWLPRTVIKHYVNSNAVTISLVCQVRCTLACPSAQISFLKKYLDAGIIC